VIDELTEELDKRGVGKRAVNLMLRADTACTEVIEALERLGLVRCLLGVESTSEQGLRALGRGSAPQANITAMKNLVRRGVMFHFNILLIHPDSTIDSIDREISGLSEVFGGLIDPFQVEVFQGTRLFEKLAREGRLRGGPLLYHFWPEEPMARRFAEIFLRLKRDAFGFLHFTAFAYEVLGVFAVARKLGLIARQSARLERRAAELIEEHNALWLDLLKQTSAFSRAFAGSAQIDDFIRKTQRRSALLTMSFNQFKQALERAVVQPLASDIFYPRTAAAVAVAVALLGAQSCASSHQRPDRSDTGIVSYNDSNVDSNFTREAGTDNDSRIAEPDSDRDASATIDKDSSEDASLCPETVVWQESHVVVKSLDDNACLEIPESCETNVSASLVGPYFTVARMILDENGYVTDIRSDGSERVPLTPELKSCYLTALKGQQFPCLKEKDQYWINCGVLLA
jgi:hypothetical protein